jgi:hypothetical protein
LTVIVQAREAGDLSCSGGEKYCYPITDSKEPEPHGQRQQKGILWIRQAGIPLIGNRQFISREFSTALQMKETEHREYVGPTCGFHLK